MNCCFLTHPTLPILTLSTNFTRARVCVREDPRVSGRAIAPMEEEEVRGASQDDAPDESSSGDHLAALLMSVLVLVFVLGLGQLLLMFFSLFSCCDPCGHYCCCCAGCGCH